MKKIKITTKAPESSTKLPEKISKEGELSEKKWFEALGQPAIDVYQTKKELVIQSALAGVKPSDLEISLRDDTLIIKGKREKITEEKEKNYFYQECYWGAFAREVILPMEVDANRIEASINEGILTIRVPKIKEGKKKIPVKET